MKNKEDYKRKKDDKIPRELEFEVELELKEVTLTEQLHSLEDS